ncbi:MAG: SAM-dependent chlorinase/fluorinase [Acidobacteria bacterium]|nr:SAM-dependent chlorinase/fluorinase [Acidobacteriota bacterium]
MITLLTDFGTVDYFVPAVKGVILKINPLALIVDITHEIPAHDICSAAFTLGACYHNFPLGAIHVAIVDPGVGSERAAIVVEAGGYFFVGPDNGIFSFVYARESTARVFQITLQDFIGRPISATFHGRDLFAPVAGYLSRGVALEDLGREVDQYTKFELSEPQEMLESGVIEGRIIHIDRFGNCITNFTDRELSFDRLAQNPSVMTIGGWRIDQFCTHFEQAIRKDELIAYPGSAGYWEIALSRGRAAELIGAKVGTKVILKRITKQTKITK